MARILPIISVVLLVLLIVLGVLLWWPQFQEFLSLKEELKAKESQLEEKREYFSRLKEYEEKLKDYNEELEKIDYALPDEISPPAIFSFFQQVCSVNGLVLENISAQKLSEAGKGSGSLKGFGFSATVSGSYENFKDFLDTLYKNSRMIDVETVSFKSPSESRFFEIGLSLKTHYLPLKSSGEGGQPPLPEGGPAF